MLMAIFVLVIGLVLLTLGAEGLVRSGISIALRLGVTPLVVALTIVSMGTGSPELFVSAQASYFGNSSLALGNIVGSNISNTALILGAAALVYPLKAKSQVVRREMPIMVFVTAVLWLMTADGELSRIDGVLLLSGSFVYTFVVYFLARRSKLKDIHTSVTEAADNPKKSVSFDLVMLLGGVALLVTGAKLLINGAVEIAKYLNVSEVVIGLTLVAFGTSLPELATSTVAAYRKEADMALGNAIGSNIVNILVILGITSIINPVSSLEIRTLDMAVMLGSAIFLWVLLGFRFLLDRLEALMLLVIYFAYIYTLVP